MTLLRLTSHGDRLLELSTVCPRLGLIGPNWRHGALNPIVGVDPGRGRAGGRRLKAPGNGLGLELLTALIEGITDAGAQEPTQNCPGSDAGAPAAERRAQQSARGRATQPADGCRGTHSSAAYSRAARRLARDERQGQQDGKPSGRACQAHGCLPSSTASRAIPTDNATGRAV
jgi:hypothetical protein